MTPYAITSGDIRPGHIELFSRVRDHVASLTDGLTCHEVCESVAAAFPVLVHRRGYAPSRGYQHSWLVIPADDILIDPYPWAASGPLMVTTVGALNPWRRLYIEA